MRSFLPSRHGTHRSSTPEPKAKAGADFLTGSARNSNECNMHFEKDNRYFDWFTSVYTRFLHDLSGKRNPMVVHDEFCNFFKESRWGIRDKHSWWHTGCIRYTDENTRTGRTTRIGRVPDGMSPPVLRRGNTRTWSVTDECCRQIYISWELSLLYTRPDPLAECFRQSNWRNKTYSRKAARFFYMAGPEEALRFQLQSRLTATERHLGTHVYRLELCAIPTCTTYRSRSSPAIIGETEYTFMSQDDANGFTTMDHDDFLDQLVLPRTSQEKEEQEEDVPTNCTNPINRPEYMRARGSECNEHLRVSQGTTKTPLSWRIVIEPIWVMSLDVPKERGLVGLEVTGDEVLYVGHHKQAFIRMPYDWDLHRAWLSYDSKSAYRQSTACDGMSIYYHIGIEPSRFLSRCFVEDLMFSPCVFPLLVPDDEFNKLCVQHVYLPEGLGSCAYPVIDEEHKYYCENDMLDTDYI